MTVNEKLRYDARHAVQASDFVQTALGSAFAQWRDSPGEWEQGARGYATRYGSRFAQHLVKRSIVFGVQAVNREDPRRIRSERAGFGNRMVDAVKYTFVAQRDDGSRGFAYSRVAGSYGAAFISRRWHPSRLHTFGSGMRAGTVSLGVETGMTVLNEFMPDVLRLLHLRR
ncbi:MAG: hypothetical protein HYZ57_16880, partial [Acidobacteria bacterium]|nr:hypothetical protein [Acidobacteriota bacterium]